MGGCAAGGPRGPETYVVRPQDTLYSIAWRHDLDYRDLARWNNIGPDYRLTIGQLLTLQGDRGAMATRPARSPAGPPANPQANQPARRPADAPTDPTATSPPPRAPSTSPPTTSTPVPSRPSVGTPRVAGELGTRAPLAGGGAKWVWPTARSGAPRPVPGGGVLLFGQLGQDVRAAGAGRVVYTGSGIRGYGNLVIIKHGDNLLSSYAHNRDLLVKEGQEVNLGQTIAHMGTGPHQVAVLYFEIRSNGKPVDPLPYLPPR